MSLLSYGQQLVLVVLPKVSGFISLVGSVLIVVAVLRSQRRRRKMYHRLLLGISCVDISSSFWLGLSTWPIPIETEILGAVGTQQTCTLQGFFTQFGITSSFYNTSLSMYYLLIIKHGWSDDRIRKIEFLLHGLPLVWGFSTAIAGLPLTLFNSANLWCWIAEYPPTNRGANADIYRWVFFYGPLWLNIIAVTIICLTIFCAVRRVEMTAEQHRAVEAQFATDHFASKQQQRMDNDRSRSRSTSSSAAGLPISLGPVHEAEEEEKNTNDENEEEVDTTPCETVVDDDNAAATEQQTRRESGATANATAARPNNNVGANNNNRRKKINYKRQSSSFQMTKRTRQVARQCFWYALAFYLNWFALTAIRLMQTIRNGNDYFNYPLLVIAAITTPIQGLPNFFIYLIPRFRVVRQTNPGATFLQQLKVSLGSQVS